MDVRDDRHPRPTNICIRPLFPPGNISTTTNHTPQGVFKVTKVLPTSAQDEIKESIEYDVSGSEEVEETTTTTYPRTDAKMSGGYVTEAD